MGLMTSINGLYEKLVLPRVPVHPDEARRRKLFISFVSIIAVTMVIFSIQHFRLKAPVYALVNFVSALLCTALIIITRFVHDGRFIYRLAVSLFFALLVYWLFTVAVEGYATLWILTCPSFTFFLFGKKEGIFWSLLLWIITAAVFFNPFGITWLPVYPETFVIRHMFTYAFLFLFTYYYESAREAYKNSTENEQRKLQMEKERLDASKKETESINLLLREEMAVRKHTEAELKRYQNNLESLIRERTMELQKKNIELEASEKRYRLLAENTSDLIWATDLDLKFTYVSPSVERMFGYTVEEAMNLSPEKMNTPEALQQLMELYDQHIKDGKAFLGDPQRHIVVELEQLKKNGEIFNVEITISLILDAANRATGIIGITRDISERIRNLRENEKIQQQLAQAQKLEAIGTLVGGIAHDFNNFLGAILGSMELLESTLKEERLVNRESIEHFLQTGLNASKRSTDLIKQLLAISRKHEIFLSPIDINDSLRHILELCKNSFPKSIILDFRISPRPLMIMGDQVQIDQVLLNICINASHAMTIMRSPDARQGGTLTVQADRVGPESVPAGENSNGRDTDAWVRISISDTGVGMTGEIQKRAFEPFFSTKSKDSEWSGSGLGLSTSYNIIQKHGGRISVSSEPGTGSCFTIYFPVNESAVERTVPREKTGDLVRGTGTILVIDDEQMIINIVRGILKRCGYTVLSAGGAGEGIAVFSEHRRDINGVIIDYNMPGKSGLDLFKELKMIDPGIRAVLASGMIDNEIKLSALEMGIKDIIHKPFLAQELSQKINDLVG